MRGSGGSILCGGSGLPEREPSGFGIIWVRHLTMKIIDLEVLDLRFPTSRTQAGTDAVHVDPDYSAAYVVLKTDAGLEGHGLTFTIGRGNEVCAAASDAFRPAVVGQRLEDITADFSAFWW